MLRRKGACVAWLCVAVWLVSPTITSAEYLGCPGEPDVTCIPGKVAARVVCARDGELLEFENVTAFCVACHSPSANEQKEAPGRASSASMQWGHAMEVEYPAYKRDFTPPSELYEAIKLTNGRVTCESCHGGSSAKNHYLSVHPRKPNLCVHCHHK